MPSFHNLTPVRLSAAGGHGHSNLSYARHLTWLSERVKEWDGSNFDIGLVGIPYDGHSRETHRGGAIGPASVRDFLYRHYTMFNDDYDTDISHLRIADCGDVEIRDSSNRIESYAAIETGLGPLFDATKALIMIGGDSDSTLGVARALIQPEASKRKIGIIDFESHYDNREMEDAAHRRGGSDWVRWLIENESTPVSGENIVIIGIHGFLYSEFDSKYAKDVGNTIFRPRDVRRLGMDEVARRALAKVTAGTEAFYVNCSVGCTFDQAFIPGMQDGSGSFVGGLMPWDVMDALVEFARHPSCRGILISTFNPLADTNKMVIKIVCEMIMQFATGVAFRTTARVDAEAGAV
jgi:arginase family enzyme